MKPSAESASFNSWSKSMLVKLEEFGRAWRTDQHPKLEEHLRHLAQQEQEAVFPTLLARELEARKKLGETPSLDDYVKRFPLYRAVVEAVFQEVRPRLPDHLKIEKALGKGGFGCVYLAFDSRLERKVAVKVPSFVSPPALDRFIKEAQRAARLRHPNIVAIHYFEPEAKGNLTFVVMDYIEGQTLETRLQQGGFQPVEAAELMLLVVDAIAYAHKNGLIAHRDLKPANILLDTSGKPYVADFGLAIATAEEGSQRAGTRAYMAPEQIRGEKLSGRCDIWAIGAILYEMVTGKKPFEGSEEELFHKIQNTDSAPFHAEGLEKIWMRCLEKQDADRDSAEDLKLALKVWLRSRLRTFQVLLTQDFKRMRNLLDTGSHERIQKAITEAYHRGQIPSLKNVSQAVPTLSTIEKYELDDDNVLLILMLDPAQNARCFMFCGAQRAGADWLDNNKYTRWVESGNELHARIELPQDKNSMLTGDRFAEARVATRNSELVVSWDEIKDFPLDGEWADWMLFLHPEQKNLAKKDFNGPVRLRGVSGSGKTSVMIHRARYLLEKYPQKILMIVPSASMRTLLQSLLEQLCKAESSRVDIRTMSGVAKKLIKTVDQSSNWRFESDPWDSVIQNALQKAIDRALIDRNYRTSILQKMKGAKLREFLTEEISYVRSRLRRAAYKHYLSPRAFPRTGRGRNMPRESREICLAAIHAYEAELDKTKILDREATVQVALELLLQPRLDTKKFRYRSVLVDEVQDLSQLEITILANLLTPEGNKMAQTPGGLFLVGDGAQTIFKRGFRLSSSGVNVSKRSYIFKKNYRNTEEILRTAYGLIQGYEFADEDEENVVQPMEPEFASRTGVKPSLVKCDSLDSEIRFVATTIQQLLQKPRRDSVYRICVIVDDSEICDEIRKALRKRQVRCEEPKDKSSLSNQVVEIHSIESAKGDEFTHVFIPRFVEGIHPRHVADHEIYREAARLYSAMTRARDNLYLSYTPGASRFLDSIKANCEHMKWDGEVLQPFTQ